MFSIFLNKFILSAGICAVTAFVGRYVASILIYPLVIPISILIGFFDSNILVFSNQGFDIRFSSRNWRWNWPLGLFLVLVRCKNLKYRRPKPSLMKSLDFRNARFGYPWYGLNLHNTTAYTLVSLPSYSAGLFRKCQIALTGSFDLVSHIRSPNKLHKSNILSFYTCDVRWIYFFHGLFARKQRSDSWILHFLWLQWTENGRLGRLGIFNNWEGKGLLIWIF